MAIALEMDEPTLLLSLRDGLACGGSVAIDPSSICCRLYANILGYSRAQLEIVVWERKNLEKIIILIIIGDGEINF
jgi:hypothetical protein